jgi:hypothetical protein
MCGLAALISALRGARSEIAHLPQEDTGLARIRRTLDARSGDALTDAGGAD